MSNGSVAPSIDYRISRATPESTAGVIGFGLVVALLVTLPLWDSDGSLQTPLVAILYYLALAQMWNLLAGLAGLISVGQQMFVGIGEQRSAGWRRAVAPAPVLPGPTTARCHERQPGIRLKSPFFACIEGARNGQHHPS